MKFYPSEISKRFSSSVNAGKLENANATGTGASFQCGSFVRISLQVEMNSKQIESAKFQTNGCGYMIAAADALTEQLIGSKLTDLHGLTVDNLGSASDEGLEEFPEDRRQCRHLVFEALRGALADYRINTINEFNGEKALVCTCFGVSEETIDKCIIEISPKTVGEVTDNCRAGGGCGSCQMLIREMIETHVRDLFSNI